MSFYSPFIFQTPWSLSQKPGRLPQSADSALHVVTKLFSPPLVSLYALFTSYVTVLSLSSAWNQVGQTGKSTFLLYKAGLIFALPPKYILRTYLGHIYITVYREPTHTSHNDIPDLHITSLHTIPYKIPFGFIL